MGPLMGQPPLYETTKQEIADYYGSDNDAIEAAQKSTAKLVSKIQQNHLKIEETDTPESLETQMEWLITDFKARGYTLTYDLQYERIGQAFVGNKLNSHRRQVALIRLNKNDVQ